MVNLPLRTTLGAEYALSIEAGRSSTPGALGRRRRSSSAHRNNPLPARPEELLGRDGSARIDTLIAATRAGSSGASSFFRIATQWRGASLIFPGRALLRTLLGRPRPPGRSPAIPTSPSGSWSSRSRAAGESSWRTWRRTPPRSRSYRPALHSSSRGARVSRTPRRGRRATGAGSRWVPLFVLDERRPMSLRHPSRLNR
jgi:hypothetical protein